MSSSLYFLSASSNSAFRSMARFKHPPWVPTRVKRCKTGVRIAQGPGRQAPGSRPAGRHTPGPPDQGVSGTPGVQRTKLQVRDRALAGQGPFKSPDHAPGPQRPQERDPPMPGALHTALHPQVPGLRLTWIHEHTAGRNLFRMSLSVSRAAWTTARLSSFSCTFRPSGERHTEVTRGHRLASPTGPGEADHAVKAALA